MGQEIALVQQCSASGEHSEKPTEQIKKQKVFDIGKESTRYRCKIGVAVRKIPAIGTAKNQVADGNQQTGRNHHTPMVAQGGKVKIFHNFPP